MPNSSACGGKKQCAQCPKAVDNAIIYASHPRGFHLPARKCEENIVIFLLQGEVLVNSKEYAGTVLHAGEFILQAIGSKYEILAMENNGFEPLTPCAGSVSLNSSVRTGITIS